MNINRQLPWHKRLFGESLDCFASGSKKQYQSDNVFRELNAKLNGKVKLVIGVYFSPLDSFSNERTNQLAQLYHAINGQLEEKGENSNESKKWHLEIIQVVLTNSSHWLDRCTIDDDSLNQRLLGLPWYVIPSAERDCLIRLTRKFEVKTLSPLLVLLWGANGELITKHGLEALAKDAVGASFPWKPRPLSQILRAVALQQAQAPECYFQSLDAAFLGFYFSAHWCPPCRCFTPQLTKAYNQLKERGVSFEVILVSSDRSRESFQEELRVMPWLAIPYEESDVRQELAALFGIQGIPSLVITDSSGEIITTDGRGELNDDPEAKKFPWKPRLVNFLNERNASRLQDHPAVVLFQDSEESDLADAEQMLTAVVEETFQQTENTLDFFIACDIETSDNLRDFLGIEDTVPFLAVVNIPEGTWSALEEDEEITKESIQEMVSKFLNNQLSKKQIGHCI